MANLTSKQAKFVTLYKDSHDSTKSALESGYSVKSAPAIGCQLLKNPKVIRELSEWRTKKSKDITKDDYIDTAYSVFRGGEFKEEPSRVRGLELVGKALGYIGSDHAPANQTLNLQINLNGSEQAGELWELTRKLLVD